jgi:hypothetical protein
MNQTARKNKMSDVLLSSKKCFEFYDKDGPGMFVIGPDSLDINYREEADEVHHDDRRLVDTTLEAAINPENMHLAAVASVGHLAISTAS